MLSLKEYYKNIFIKSLQEAATQEQPEAEEQHWNPAENHPLHIPNYARENPGLWGNDPTLFNPLFFPKVAERWPPIPSTILPMWSHPNGDMIWIVPGPPTVVYIRQIIKVERPGGISSIRYHYVTLVSANNDVPVSPGSPNWTWYAYRSGGRHNMNGNIHFDGWNQIGDNAVPLDKIWPGWHNPYTPPTSGNNPLLQDTYIPGYNGYGQVPWDNVPTYPGWDADQPNWVRPNPWTPYDDRINWHIA